MDLLWTLLKEVLGRVNSASDFFFFILWIIYIIWLFYLWVRKLYSFLLWGTIWLLVFIALYYLLPIDAVILWFARETILQISIYFVIIFWVIIQRNLVVLELSSSYNLFSKILVFIIAILFIPAVIVGLIEREWIFDIPNIFRWVYYMPFWEDIVATSWIYWFFKNNIQNITTLWIITSLFFMFFNKIFASIWSVLTSQSAVSTE